MKSLYNYISEKLIINKSFNNIEYDFYKITTIYLVEFEKRAFGNGKIHFTVFKIDSLKPTKEKYIINCRSITGYSTYKDCTLLETNEDGVLLRYGVETLEIFIHPYLKNNFKNAVFNVDVSKEYDIYDILELLNFEIDDIDESFYNRKYDIMDNTEFKYSYKYLT